MKIVRQLDRSVWSKFVDRHPLGNIFHTPEMHEMFFMASRGAAVIDIRCVKQAVQLTVQRSFRLISKDILQKNLCLLLIFCILMK